MAERKFYRLYVVRKAPIADPEEYTEAIDKLVRTLQHKDPPRFYLSANSPAHKLYPVIDGDESNVWRFVSTSEIQWGHGRDPGDPTHQVVFFNEHKDDNYVRLNVKFFVKPPDDPGSPPKPDDGPPEHPGLVASLSFGLESAGPPGSAPPDQTRGEYLDELFSLLVTTFKPDHGHIEVPDHPESDTFPRQYDVGWLTYLSRKELPVPPALAAPASVVPLGDGTKLVAVAPLTQQTYPEIEQPVELVREALRPRAIEQVAAPKPPSVPPTRVQRPSYMRDPVTGLPIHPSPSAGPSAPATVPQPIVAPPMMAPIPKRESFDYEAPPEHVAMPYVDDVNFRPAVNTYPRESPLIESKEPPSARSPVSEGGLIPQITQELSIIADDTQDLDASELERIRQAQEPTPFDKDRKKKPDDDEGK